MMSRTPEEQRELVEHLAEVAREMKESGCPLNTCSQCGAEVFCTVNGICGACDPDIRLMRPKDFGEEDHQAEHCGAGEPELQEFIRRCRKIVEVLANSQSFPCGFVRVGRAYEDDEITIACDPKSPAMEIEIHPPLHPDKQHNPVVHITAEGHMIRHHGEWIYARVKVDRMYRELSK